MGKDDKIHLRVRNGSELTGKVERPDAPKKPVSAKRARAAENMHPSGLRRVTERRVAHLLLRSPGLSRVELAREIGLSVAAVGKIVDSLVSAGLVEKIVSETAKPGPTLGRPAEYFGLARSRARYVVVELGVYKTQLAALPIAGPVGDIQTAQFRTTAELEVLTRRLTTAMKMLDIEDPLAVLVSTPGVVDEEQQRVLYSPNLHWTEGDRLFETIREAIPSRILVVQELRALALGHLVRAESNDSYLLVHVGYGVGGALVVNGRLQTGPLPLSAEVGHTPIPGNRRRCGCGGTGCLETLLDRRGLLRTARRQMSGSIRTWSQLTNALADKDMPEWLANTLSDASSVIAGALNATGVAKVVLIGDLLELGPAVLEYMTQRINANALWGRFGNVRVEAAPRQRLLGLARAALDRVALEPSAAERAIGTRSRGASA